MSRPVVGRHSVLATGAAAAAVPSTALAGSDFVGQAASFFRDLPNLLWYLISPGLAAWWSWTRSDLGSPGDFLAVVQQVPYVCAQCFCCLWPGSSVCLAA